jgi:hypothetical protein
MEAADLGGKVKLIMPSWAKPIAAVVMSLAKS